MLRLLRLTLLLIMLTVLATAGVQSGLASMWQTRVDPGVLARLDSRDVNAETNFLVVLSARADLSDAAFLTTKVAKGEYVYRQLRETASATQTPLVTLLTQRGATFQRFWIQNMILVRGDRTLLRSLALQPSVDYIYDNAAYRHELADRSPELRSHRATEELLWNLSQINAPALWARGITGQGVVIGGQDTGYDWTHPALQPAYRGWDGVTADHNYNWHDAIHEENPFSVNGNRCGYDVLEPCDDQSHGTHTMGTMAGDPPDDDPTGVAPGATWIGCRNMEDGWGTPATYAECFEWFIAPYPLGGDPFIDGDPAAAPHVINNSWSCPTVEGCTVQTVLEDVVEAVRAAGIVTVQSAGNNGGGCGTITTPAAIYNASYTVGATDFTDTIAGFSSRGPTPGGLLKPDVSAPGVGILSTMTGGGYGFLSGTSMAAPHVAGAVALLISAEPGLAGNVEAIEALLNQSAAPQVATQSCGTVTGDQIPNHVYGWGRIDLLAAYNRLAPDEMKQLFVPIVTGQ